MRSPLHFDRGWHQLCMEVDGQAIHACLRTQRTLGDDCARAKLAEAHLRWETFPGRFSRLHPPLLEYEQPRAAGGVQVLQDYVVLRQDWPRRSGIAPCSMRSYWIRWIRAATGA